MVHDLGGAGRPILVLHGLMGAATTWRAVAGWLGTHGRVWALDAAGHGGADAGPWNTERFVADVTDAVREVDDGPVVVWGHSMGGLHAWCFAAAHPDLVRGLIVEEMAPDFRGRTAAGWSARARAWPSAFADVAALRDEFGAAAGEYFAGAFTRTAAGWVPHGDPAVWVAIATEWGVRDYWTQWRAVQAPTLLLEAEHSITPVGQMAAMAASAAARCTHVVVPGVGHLPHAEAPETVRAAVSRFLRTV